MKKNRGPSICSENIAFFFFFFTIQGEIVWAKPIPIEARGVKGKEASGTKFSPKLVEIK